MKREYNGEVKFYGYIKDLMDEITSKLNYEYEFLLGDGLYGAQQDNGSWTGVVGDLLNKTSDLAAAALTITKTRMNVVDFSLPFQTSGPVLVMLKPERERMQVIKERLTKLLTPFEFSVWLLAIIAFMVTSTILYIISYFNPYEWRRMAHDGEATLREMESFTCLNSFWFTLSTMAWQGYTRSPRSIGGRIVVTAWWLFVVIFVACYIANLTNLLKRPLHTETYTAAVQSLSDLANQNQMKPLVLASGATSNFLEHSRVPFLAAIQRTLESDPKLKVNTHAEGFDMLTKGDKSYGFIAESMIARYVAGNDCSIYFVNDFIVNRYEALAFPKKSDLKVKFDNIIIELQENGMLYEIQERWFKGTCDQYILDVTKEKKIEIPVFFQVELGTFSGAVLILAAGLVLGGLVTVVEIVLFRFAESVSIKWQSFHFYPVRTFRGKIIIRETNITLWRQNCEFINEIRKSEYFLLVKLNQSKQELGFEG
ncbi:hypothetical protein KUTeg_014392 [Tegillarca granosa]|uniref:Uncharacterized protein n=1 Tax=Tegillarca granosa TaxID=220873 RepID=A0ABQ9EWH0_TEGGR|nr:hypothetical protein KUTeg_014392 [Tegillarca granosa]